MSGPARPLPTPECPDCSSPLEEEQHLDLVVDRCRRCQGIWFDEGELLAFRRSAVDGAGLPPSERAIAFRPLRFQGAIDCPRCRAASLEVGEALGWRLGRCSRCRGVWVEGRRLRQLLEPRDGAGGLDSWWLSLLGELLTWLPRMT
ncbi:MAG: zf-TFIIB domain-containing protein [Planctomycetes bacterium]|nr:zf-TFIIB domain-containing protein [Planctomycetota bacterium]MBL7009246.1 zf-TFIIB domain-containing protein [Planctomycetota bacterium]